MERFKIVLEVKYSAELIIAPYLKKEAHTLKIRRSIPQLSDDDRRCSQNGQKIALKGFPNK